MSLSACLASHWQEVAMTYARKSSLIYKTVEGLLLRPQASTCRWTARIEVITIESHQLKLQGFERRIAMILPIRTGRASTEISSYMEFSAQDAVSLGTVQQPAWEILPIPKNYRLSEPTGGSSKRSQIQPST